jgi:quercetin dioxygenase-like cupin family protein
MPAIRIFDAGTADLVQTQRNERTSVYGEGELRAHNRMHHVGSATELQLFEVQIEADDRFQPHAHEHDEIIFVLEGELRLGNRVVAPGSSVYIPARTLYTLSAGPEGVRFLNFRAAQDLSYLRAEDLRTHDLRGRGDTSGT